MNFYETTLVALALAADCFAVAFTAGLTLKYFNHTLALRMAFFFALFQAAMPTVGWFGMNTFVASWFQYSHIVAFVLLAIVGGKMVKSSCCHTKACDDCKAQTYTLATIIFLAIATSLDALFVGISFPCMGYHTFGAILPVIANIGIVAFTLTLLAFMLGLRLGTRLKYINLELIGGLILIGLGIKILFN